jgi:hypothetical protein
MAKEMQTYFLERVHAMQTRADDAAFITGQTILADGGQGRT